ncbi:hypothetical protein SAMN06265222_116114 [Neorhodopirellula lusitana]|uniref:PepSY-associated TM helix domain-containing protein n=1 Tax=Neorhodopirellula lusitana TaxID=445327 RepID=A0ABY1QKK9_9BACT|nr:PepSY-associated TM helix domain-containing protein [Neorhodopirellula lusitana]SMP73394.1 hypothetical protein SAMN06265222_116114 [Neorhodopirellula lusitana]
MTPPPTKKKRSRRSIWLRFLIHSHWMSSAISLIGMILFAVTGITLNHASQIKTVPVVQNRLTELPADLKQKLDETGSESDTELPPEISTWLSNEFAIPTESHPAEVSEDEVYISMPGPGSDAWIAVDRASGEVEFESTSRGWISYLNDLHKGRNTGFAWMVFLDVFSVATLVFCITGLFLLYERSKNRWLTWPLVIAGLVAPWVLILLLVH